MPKKSDSNYNLSVDELLSSISDEIDEKKLDSSKTWSIDEIDELLGLEEKKSSKSKPHTSSEIKHEEIVTKPREKKETFFKDVNKETHKNSEVTNNKKVDKSPKAEVDTKVKISNKEVKQPANTKTNQENKLNKKVDYKKDVKPVENTTKKHEEYIDTTPQEKQKVLDLAEQYAPTPKPNKDFEHTKKAQPVKTQKSVETPKVEEQKRVIKDVPQKTIADVTPTYNENIKHHIKKKKIEKHSSAMETNKYRERFINAPVQHLEKTSEYQKMHENEPAPFVERPGFIVKKKDFRGTADLEPIPTIISADEELDKVNQSDDTEKKQEEKKNPDEIDGQIKLLGFNEEEKLDQIDEEEAEEELREKRVDKINSFKMDHDLGDFPTQMLGNQINDELLKKAQKEKASDDVEDDTITDEDLDNFDDFDDEDFYEDTLANESKYEEYENAEQAPELLKKLTKGCKTSFGFAIAGTIVFVISLVINTLYNTSGLALLPGLNELNFLLVNIFLLILSAVFSASSIIKGIKGLAKFNANASSGGFLLFVLSLAQCIVLTVTFKNNIPDGTLIFAPVASFALAFNAISKYITLKRVQKNFAFCTGGTHLHSTEKIYNEDDAFEIGRGLLLGEPDIRYSAKIKFPTDFMANSFSNDPVDSLSRILVPIVMAISAIVAVVKGVLTKDPLVGFNAFIATSSVGIPLFALFISNLPLLLINKKLNERGGALLGHNPAFQCSGTNAVVVDSEDLFMKGFCNIDGIKMFHNMRIDEAILEAAALVIKAGGPLVSVFDGVILNRREILPQVESIAYEDRLGLSAWIHGRRVLLGSKDLLKNHNVEVPDNTNEEKFLKQGKKVMYLAVAGKIAAMFVVSYFVNDNIAKVLQNIEDSGVTILVKTCDSNITESMLCRYFDLDENDVKIITPVSGEIFDSYKKETLDNSSSGLYHNGTDDSFIKSVIQSLRLNKIVSINSILQIIYTCIAVIGCCVLLFLPGFSIYITPLKIIILQTVFAIVASLTSIVKKR